MEGVAYGLADRAGEDAEAGDREMHADDAQCPDADAHHFFRGGEDAQENIIIINVCLAFDNYIIQSDKC